MQVAPEVPMTYEELYDLKYRKGLSTYELVRRFPEDTRRISEVALLEVPESTLREIIAEQETLHHLMALKKLCEGVGPSAGGG